MRTTEHVTLLPIDTSNPSEVLRDTKTYSWGNKCKNGNGCSVRRIVEIILVLLVVFVYVLVYSQSMWGFEQANVHMIQEYPDQIRTEEMR